MCLLCQNPSCSTAAVDPLPALQLRIYSKTIRDYSPWLVIWAALLHAPLEIGSHILFLPGRCQFLLLLYLQGKHRAATEARYPPAAFSSAHLPDVKSATWCLSNFAAKSLVFFSSKKKKKKLFSTLNLKNLLEGTCFL